MSPDNFIEIVDCETVDDTIKEKLNDYRRLFKARTNTDLSYIVRAPGRINLIGDHIDYHGFAVLPMAIENSIWLGCSFIDRQLEFSQIKIFNQDNDLFPNVVHKHSLDIGCQLNLSYKWYNYIFCSYHGVIRKELFKVSSEQALHKVKSSSDFGDQNEDRLNKLPEFNVMIWSNLPQASGLSSSSALVCASAVATHLLLCSTGPEQQPKLDSKQIAEDCSNYERLTGTHGGGMDQAVIMTAHDNFAKYVEFMPRLVCNDVELPGDVVWLISHCGTDYPKAATAGFNSRVLETKLGAAIIVKVLSNGTSNIALDKTISLGKVKRSLLANKSVDSIVSLLKESVFPKDVFYLDEICSALELSEIDLLNKFNTTKSFLDENFQNGFLLRRRCEHVFEEAERVQKFKAICDTTKDCKILGDLMTQSHYSLRDKYDCSHEALDRLVDISLKSGALGARVTGAGWGGCIITLVKIDKCQIVLDELRKVSKFTMKTEPQSGCRIIKF